MIVNSGEKSYTENATRLGVTSVVGCNQIENPYTLLRSKRSRTHHLCNPVVLSQSNPAKVVGFRLSEPISPTPDTINPDDLETEAELRDMVWQEENMVVTVEEKRILANRLVKEVNGYPYRDNLTGYYGKHHEKTVPVLKKYKSLIKRHSDAGDAAKVAIAWLDKRINIVLLREYTAKHINRHRNNLKRDYAETYAAIVDRDGEFCVRCRGTEKLTIDHIIPLKLLGRGELSNLQLLCKPCNSSKGCRVKSAEH